MECSERSYTLPLAAGSAAFLSFCQQFCLCQWTFPATLFDLSVSLCSEHLCRILLHLPDAEILLSAASSPFAFSSFLCFKDYFSNPDIATLLCYWFYDLSIYICEFHWVTLDLQSKFKLNSELGFWQFCLSLPSITTTGVHRYAQLFS